MVRVVVAVAFTITRAVKLARTARAMSQSCTRAGAACGYEGPAFMISVVCKG